MVYRYLTNQAESEFASLGEKFIDSWKVMMKKLGINNNQ